MAKITNAVTSYETRAVSEVPDDVQQQIVNIDPSDTPFTSLIGNRKVTSTMFEWLTEDLNTASAGTPKEEGFAFSAETHDRAVRHNNFVQILTRNATVSNTTTATRLYGKNSEMSHQMAKKGKELKRDVNYSFMHPQIKASGGDPNTPRKSAMLSNWIKTNVSKGTGGANPTGDGTDNRTNGTQRALTLDLIDDVAQLCYQNGAEPSVLLVGPHNKGVVSGLGGRGIAQEIVSSNTAGSNVTLVQTSFGTLKVIPHRWQQERDAWMIDAKYLKMAQLRPYQSVEMARTGDGVVRQMTVEYGLQVDTEKSQGLVADLTTS